MCEPYDLGAVLRGFDADVIVMQESWTPDAGTSAVREFGESVGAEVFELRFGRARLEPGRTSRVTGMAWARSGSRS